MTVYKLRHIESGEFHGRGKHGQVYTQRNHATCALTNMSKEFVCRALQGLPPSHHPNEYELVAYELTEIEVVT